MQDTSSLLSLAAVDETEFCRSQPGCFGFSLQGNTTECAAITPDFRLTIELTPVVQRILQNEPIWHRILGSGTLKPSLTGLTQEVVKLQGLVEALQKQVKALEDRQRGQPAR